MTGGVFQKQITQRYGPLHSHTLCSSQWLLIWLASILIFQCFLPVFGQHEEQLEFSVSEGSPPNTVVGKINKRPGFSYRLNENNAYFRFEPTSGDILTSVYPVLDRESIRSGSQNATYVDLVILGAEPTFFITVRITVLDINDHAPQFSVAFHNVSIPESSKLGTSYALPSADDSDQGRFGTIERYRITSGNEDNSFKLVQSETPSGDSTLSLELITAVDRERTWLYTMNITAKDGGSPPLTGYLTVYVNVLDSNDNAPVFDHAQYKVTVSENVPTGTSVLTLEASDADVGENAQIMYTIRDDSNHQFAIDSITGIVSVRTSPLKCPEQACPSKGSASQSRGRSISNEDISSNERGLRNCSRACIFSVEALDHGTPGQRGRSFVDITLENENNHTPDMSVRLFPPGSTHHATVSSTSASNSSSLVALVTMQDKDFGENGETILEIVDGNEANKFNLQQAGSFYMVRIDGVLNRDITPKYQVKLRASDRGVPPRSTETTLLVYVNNANTEPPHFDKPIYTTIVSEKVRIGSYVTTVKASMKSGSNTAIAPRGNPGILYSIVDGNDLGWFRINRFSGAISTAKELDYEIVRSVKLAISARDLSPNLLSGKSTVEIDIQDENDHEPVCTKKESLVKIKENTSRGKLIAEITATDTDTNNHLNYTIINSFEGTFRIDSTTGYLYLEKTLDYESMRQYHVQVKVSDSGIPSLSSVCSITVLVLDENDHSPVFYPENYFATLTKSTPLGTSILKVAAVDSDAGPIFGSIQYSLSGGPWDLFSLDPFSGELILTSQLIEHRNTLTVTARDGGGKAGTNNGTVRIYLVESEAGLPKFSQTHYEFDIDEDLEGAPAIGKVVGKVSASAVGSQLFYKLTGGDPNSQFSIGQYSGEIRATKPLDADNNSEYKLTVVAFSNEAVSVVEVMVHIKDLNDNLPHFDEPSPTPISIDRTWPLGRPVYFASASDSDLTDHDKLTFDLLDNFMGAFQIDISNGLISLGHSAWFLQEQQYKLTVTVHDSMEYRHLAKLDIIVNVVGVDDSHGHLPSEVDLVIPPNTEVGTKLHQLQSSESCRLHVLGFSDNSPIGIFADGWLYLNVPLNQLNMSMGNVKVQCSDPETGTPLMNTLLHIHSIPSNFHAPVCLPAVLTIVENEPAFTFIGYILATDEDVGINGKLTYQLTSLTDVLELDKTSGELISLRSFDREQLKASSGFDYLTARFRVHDNGLPQLSTDCELKIIVKDANDHHPVFDKLHYFVVVPEDAKVNTEILRLSATDVDDDKNGVVFYRLVSTDVKMAAMFKIGETTGRLMLLHELDRESVDKYKLIVEAYDGGSPVMTSRTTIHIEVSDVNDNEPKFTNVKKTNFRVPEDTVIGTTIGVFTATDKDRDINAHVRYIIVSGDLDHSFELNQFNGNLILVKSLDYEAVPAHRLVIKASDEGYPSKSTNFSILIQVQDTNDNAPEILTGSLIGQVSEDSPIGTVVMKIQARDNDFGRNAKLSFRLGYQIPDKVFRIGTKTGQMTLQRSLDREKTASYKVEVIVSDMGDHKLTSRRTATVIVTDSNDNTPTIVSPTAAVLPTNARADYVVSQLRAVDPDLGGNGTVSFRFSGDSPDTLHFSLDSRTGTVRLKKMPYPAKPTYNFNIEAVDGGSQPRQFHSDSLSDGINIPKVQFTVVTVDPSVIERPSPSYKFIKNRYSMEAAESLTIGSHIGRIGLTGSKASLRDTKFYITAAKSDSGGDSPLWFDITEGSGEIRVVSRLDADVGFSDQVLDVVALNSDNMVAFCQVLVTILDINDNPPAFSVDLYQFSAVETSNVGTKIGRVVARDADKDDRIIYSLKSTGVPFRINADSGEISVGGPIDRESRDKYFFEVISSDGVYSTVVPVEISILDLNDEKPDFGTNQYRFRISENSPRGSFVGLVHATDNDYGINGTVSYQFARDSDVIMSQWFRLNSVTGVMTLNGYLDHEKNSIFVAKVEAMNKAVIGMQLTSSVEVVIEVVDRNDNDPTFTKTQYHSTVAENASIGTHVLDLTVNDKDTDSHFWFEIVEGDVDNIFKILSNGTMIIANGLDREIESSFDLKVIVFDQLPGLPTSVHRRQTTTRISIIITDVNDNSPNFVSPMEAVVSENTGPGTIIAILQAIDPDDGHNSYVEYYIDPLSGNDFSVDPVHGFLRPRHNLDRETMSDYNLTIWAFDHGSPPLRTNATFHVNVLDSNDHMPVFIHDDLRVKVSESSAVGTTICQLQAMDLDLGANAQPKFEIISGDPDHVFDLEADSGALVLSRNLNYETYQSFNLSVMVTNWVQFEGHGEPLVDTRAVKIIVIDTNDHRPVFQPQIMKFQVYENTIIPVSTPMLIGRISAVDADTGRNGKVAYSIIQGNASVFDLDSHTGQLKLLLPLDRETQHSYSLTVTATDSGVPRLTGIGNILIEVLDVNDNAPVFEENMNVTGVAVPSYYQTSVSENVDIGTEILTVLATDIDLGLNGIVRYSLNDTSIPFSIDADSGVIRTIRSLDREKKPDYIFEVLAKDLAPVGLSLTGRAVIAVDLIDINDNAPVFYNTPKQINVPSNARLGQFLYVFDATDNDDASNAIVEYELEGGSDIFTIDRVLGVLSARLPLDSSDTYKVSVKATDKGSEKLSSVVEVAIIPYLGSEFPTYQETAAQKFEVEENRPGQLVTTFVARSPKQPPFDRLHYSIIAGNNNGAFQINPITGQLYTGHSLDREEKDRYNLFIAASDNDNRRLSSISGIQVTVLDTNDNHPKFSQKVYKAVAIEEKPAGDVIAEVKVTDVDLGINADIRYEITAGNQDGKFKVDPKSGLVRTIGVLDRELISQYQLTITANDLGSPSLNSESILIVSVLDVDDNAPKFTRLLRGEIAENAPIGSFVTKVTSSDADTKKNSNHTYELTVNPGGKFTIDPASGNVTVNGTLDREVKDRYNLKVVARDGAWRIETSLTIFILDLNDHSPVFDTDIYIFTLPDDINLPFSVGSVNAKDNDEGINSKVTYSMAKRSNIFRVDHVTGEITMIHKISSINNEPIELMIIAQDSGHPIMHSMVTVKIQLGGSPVKLVNNVPVHFALLVDMEPGDTIGTVDDGTNDDSVSYSLTDNHDGLFGITPKGVLSLANGTKQFSVSETFYLKVNKVSKVESLTSTVTVTVTKPNSNKPQFVSHDNKASVVENAPVGFEIITVNARDADQGLNGKLSYLLVDSDGSQFPPFNIDPMSGVIRVNGSVNHETVTLYELTVKVVDHGYKQLSATTNVKIEVVDQNDNVPQFYAASIDAFLLENLPSGSFVIRVTAADIDSAPYNRIEYGFISGNENGVFKINQNSGEISTEMEIDMEETQFYLLKAYATNPGFKGLVSEITINVHIVGENEFRPQFTRNEFTFNAPSRLTIGQRIGQLLATDRDEGVDGQIVYLLETTAVDEGISIDRNTGYVTSTKDVYIQSKQLIFKVFAKNPFDPNTDHMAQTALTINFAPDLSLPRFELKSEKIKVAENVQVGTNVVKIAARGNGLEYSIIKGNRNMVFRIDPESGQITNTGIIDREKTDGYHLLIQAQSESRPEITTTMEVDIDVTDTNDNAPRLTDEGSVGFIMEGDQVGTSIMTLHPIDDDIQPNGGPFQFEIVPETINADLFELDRLSGILKNRVVFDREEQDEYTVMVRIGDAGKPRMTSTVTTKILVRDINDQPSKPRNNFTVILRCFGDNFDGGILADVKPIDLDVVGDYSCTLKDHVELFQIKTGCQLSSKRVTKVQNLFGNGSYHTLSITGSDGRHSAVNYKAKVIIESIATEWIDKTVDMVIEKTGSGPDKTMESVAKLSEMVAKDHQIELIAVGLDTVQDRKIVSFVGVDVRKIAISPSNLYRILQSLNIYSIVGRPKFQQDLCLTLKPCLNDGSCELLVIKLKTYSSLDSDQSIISLPRITRSYKCQCQEPFQGTHCEIKVNHCYNSPCQNGGTCEFAYGHVTCQCPFGFEGKHCEDDIDECTSDNPCMNDGHCENVAGDYMCICMLGSSGRNCENREDACQRQQCLNDGICVQTADGFTCKCEFGFSGKHCEQTSKGFDLLSYIELPPFDAEKNELTIQFATLQRNAILVYSYDNDDGSNDYVALDIVEGQLRLSGRIQDQGQMNLKLARPVNDGKWYQVQIMHYRQTITISVGECKPDRLDCDQCSVGDKSCIFTANTGFTRILMPDQNIYLGGSGPFEHVQARIGQISHFGFVGCIRNFELNDNGLEGIMIKEVNVLDYCPRETATPCEGSSKDSIIQPCGSSEQCVDRFDTHQCRCEGGAFVAYDCNEGEITYGFRKDSLLRYRLRQEFKQRLQFTPVDPSSIRNSDDLLRAKRSSVRLARRDDSIYVNPDITMALMFRTKRNDGVIFFARSGELFTLIDLMDGNVRYVSQTLQGEAITIVVKSVDGSSFADGEWHYASLQINQNGHKIAFGVDGVDKEIHQVFPVHQFLNTNLTDFAIGGAPVRVEFSGNRLIGFEGCISKFILNGQLQPLYSGGKSDFLEVVSSDDGVFEGCASKYPIADHGAGLHVGVIAVIVFFVCVIFAILVIFGGYKYFRHRRQKQKEHSTVSTKSDISSTKFNNLAIISQPSNHTTQSFNSGNTLQTGVSGAAFIENPEFMHQARMMENGMNNQRLSNINRNSVLNNTFDSLDSSHFSLGINTSTPQPPPLPKRNQYGGVDPLPNPAHKPTTSARPAVSQLGVNDFNSWLHVGDGAYQNSYDTTQDEFNPEHYDLDNASSIAPSDVDISHHFNEYQQLKKAQQVNNARIDKIKDQSSGLRNSPSSLISNTPYRQSPAETSVSSVKQRNRHYKERRDSPANSLDLDASFTSGNARRSSRKGNRSRASSTSRHSQRSKSSSKSSGRRKRAERSSHSTGALMCVSDISSGARYLSNTSQRSRSSTSSSEDNRPRAPPRRSLMDGSLKAPQILSRSPHAPPLRDSSTERETDCQDYPAYSKASQIPGLLHSSGLSKRQPDETETDNDYASDVLGGGTRIPELSAFVNRGNELKNLIRGHPMTSSQETVSRIPGAESLGGLNLYGPSSASKGNGRISRNSGSGSTSTVKLNSGSDGPDHSRPRRKDLEAYV